MKKAINIWSFGKKTVKESIALARDAGFDGIELALDTTGDVSLESTQERLQDIKQYAQSAGIAIPSVASGLYWSWSLTSNDEGVREKAVNIAIKQIETAKLLGADSVLIVPGAVGVDFLPDSEVVPYDTAYERSLAAFKVLKKTAEQVNISVGIENVWNKFLLSPIEMKNFIDEIDSPYIGAYFDVGNVVCSGYPEHWIRILGPRIKNVHFKDYRREVGGIAGFVDLLAGDVDWPEVMRAFEEIGYDGWFTAEMLPPYMHYSEQIIYNTSASMTKILGGKDYA